MATATKWHASAANYKKGRYWSIRARRNGDRVNLTLGYVSEEDAQRAAEQMVLEEKLGRALRVIDWHKEDREGAVLYLVGDPGADALINGEPDYERMTLSEYQETVYAPWREKAAPASWAKELGYWKKLLPALGDQELRQVDAHAVADYLDTLMVTRGARTGLPMSGNTKRLHRAAVQALLKRAYRLKHIRELPDLSVFRIKGSTKRARQKPDPLSLEELVAIMDVSKPKQRAMWAVGGGQGLRPSELARIRWEDISFKRKTLKVRGSKTEASLATVPLTGLSRRELLRWHEHCGEPTEGLVFPGRDGELYGDGGFKRPLKTAAKAAGIERRVYPYLLRDSFATIAWGLGVDMDIARRILRHTDETMLREVYCRPRPEDIAKFVEMFDYAG